MKYLPAALLAALCLEASPRAQPPARAGAASLVIHDVTLIDGTGAAPREHASLVVRDGRIAAIVDAGAAEPAADLVVNGAGLFAIPGLFDAHVHLSPSNWDQRAADLRRLLRGGVTSVWDVAGDVRETGAASSPRRTGRGCERWRTRPCFPPGPAIWSRPASTSSRTPLTWCGKAVRRRLTSPDGRSATSST
ncbi:MAG: amidohydrolase family protein [Betaproteobacteria bacterium]